MRLKFSDLVKIVAMVEHHGQSSKLMRTTSAIKTSVRVPAEAATAVKEVVSKHAEMRSSPLGKRVLFARKTTQAVGVARAEGSVATGNDYCCGFGPGG